MYDLKIAVRNKQEAIQAQYLFFQLGYGFDNGEGKEYIISEYVGEFYLFAYAGDKDLTHSCDKDLFDMKNHTEVTLLELSAMVSNNENIKKEPIQKEYLNKLTDGSYKLVVLSECEADGLIEVPDGAVIAIQFYACDTIAFYDKDCYYLADGNKEEIDWNMTDLLNNGINLKDNVHGCDISHRVLWSREEVSCGVSNLSGVDLTLSNRQAQYGNFEDVAFVTENIMQILGKVKVNGLNDLPHTHRMALYMIASKMARIVNGDFNKLDSWHDIGGYAKLIENLIGGDV